MHIMNITCNGARRDVEAGTTVIGLIGALELNPDTVVVEYNGKILARESYRDFVLEDGAVLEIIRFVGGG